MPDPAWTLLWSGGVSLLAALAITPFVIWLAQANGWVADPRADRWHEMPTALMGGIGIFAAATLGLVASLGVVNFPWFLWSGATLLFLTGLVDDLRGVRPVTKLVMQVLATVILLYAGYSFGGGSSPFWIAIPLTFLWVIGITNAVNLLDNMDGLAAGTVAIVAVMLAIFALMAGGNGGSVFVMVAIAGATCGFLYYNFKPARIFMGDCGSLFLGYTLAAYAIIIQGGISGAEGLGIYVVSIAVLAVPIFDTTLVTIVRTLAGRSLSQGGQDHSSHRLVRLGLSESKAVLTLYIISIMFGGIAIVFHVAEVNLFYAITAMSLVGLGVFGVHLGRMDVYKRSSSNGVDKTPLHRRAWREIQERAGQQTTTILRAVLGRSWKPVIGMSADLILVSSAFVLAHYLRFEGGLGSAREAQLMSALPLVVFLKLGVFLLGGLYRGMWRHAGVQELMRIVFSTTGASIVTFGVLTALYGWGQWSLAVFFIDWMIVTLVITMVRFGFRGLHQYFRSHRLKGKRTLVCGAGDAGLLMLRALRQQIEVGLRPVGFVDDDSYKRGYTAQGLAVLGTLCELENVCEQHRIEEVLVPAWQFPEERQAEIFAACGRAGVSCRVFSLALQPSRDLAAPALVERQPTAQTITS